MLEKVKVTPTEIDELVSVIKEVWPEAFVPIIGQAQVDYNAGYLSIKTTD